MSAAPAVTDEGNFAIRAHRLRLIPQLHSLAKQPWSIGGNLHEKDKRFEHPAQFNGISQGLRTNHSNVVIRILESSRYGIGKQKILHIDHDFLHRTVPPFF